MPSPVGGCKFGNRDVKSIPPWEKAMPLPPASSVTDSSEANHPERETCLLQQKPVSGSVPKPGPTFPPDASDSPGQGEPLSEGVTALITELSQAYLEVMASFGMPTDGQATFRLQLGPAVSGWPESPWPQGPCSDPCHMGTFQGSSLRGLQETDKSLAGMEERVKVQGLNLLPRVGSLGRSWSPSQPLILRL